MTRTQDRRSGERRRSRLPTDVRPSLIDLHLELDPERRDFRGEARYELRIGRRKQSLRLHASGLRVSRIRLHVGGAVWTGRVETGDDETIELAFDWPVPAGGHRLDLAFRGRVRGDMRGLYRGETRGHPWLASQLCPTDARRLFPCFDEPAIKARHRIRVTAPRDQAVISNAPVELEAPTSDGLRKTVQFETTPPLSAYLIAVAVGPFEASPALRSGSTEIRVHTLPGRQQLATFAREAAAESLERLERWFDLPHPYPKVDLVALPDFAFGAMENAGAVFFRDSILLLDAAEASQADRKRAGEVIAHELSHMWFGNLVTMAWWNDLWLNESFATWMAYEIVDSWQPDWRIWLDFAHRREAALAADALASSHPIAPPIRNAEEAQENFDAITYTKGACVLRMLEHHLGAETFREGIRLYIRRHREASAEAADLWAALEEVSDHPIEEIVAPWILQTGFPLVSIRRRPRQETGALELQQARFLALPPKAPRRAGTPEKRRAEPHWKIPWIGRIGRGTSREDGLVRHLITRRSERLPGPGTQPAFLYGNANEAGFFRVEHDEQALRELIADCPSLSPIERIGLIGHQWALARAGRASIAPLLDLLASLGQEDEPEVLRSVEDVLGEIGRSLAPSRGAAVEERLRTWIAVHFGAQVDRLGFEPREGEDERSALRRARILGLIGGLARDETVERHCQGVARLHLESGRPLPRELADVILAVAAQQADAELQAALCDATRRAPTPQARQRTLFALAEVESADGVARSLAACDDEGLAPLADRASLLAGLLSRRESAPAAWRHLQRRWSRLEKSLPPILLARLARSTARGLPPELADEVRAFFQRHPLAAGRRVSRQIQEDLAVAERFERTAGPALEAHLSV